MSTGIINSTDIAQCGIRSIFYVSGATLVIGALVCFVALSAILNNHLKLAITSKLCDNVAVLKPGVVDTLWSVAKWSGVTSACALGPLALITLCAFRHI